MKSTRFRAKHSIHQNQKDWNREQNCNPWFGLYNPWFGLHNPCFGFCNPNFEFEFCLKEREIEKGLLHSFI